MKLKTRLPARFSEWPAQLQQKLRDKAISRARTRIIVAGKRPEDFSPEDLEVIVKEEEDKLRNNLKEKGLLAVAAIFGLGWWL